MSELQAYGIGRPWTREEDKLLTDAVAIHGYDTEKWKTIAEAVPGRTNKACRKRWLHSLSPSVKKTAWTAEEDRLLLTLYEKFQTRWALIARQIPGRTDDACSKRYREALDPNLRKDDWNDEEDRALLAVYDQFGGKWGRVGQELRRSGLACRNRWRLLERKRTAPPKQLPCISNSAFLSRRDQGSHTPIPSTQPWEISALTYHTYYLAPDESPPVAYTTNFSASSQLDAHGIGLSPVAPFSYASSSLSAALDDHSSSPIIAPAPPEAIPDSSSGLHEHDAATIPAEHADEELFSSDDTAHYFDDNDHSMEFDDPMQMDDIDIPGEYSTSSPDTSTFLVYPPIPADIVLEDNSDQTCIPSVPSSSTPSPPPAVTQRQSIPGPSVSIAQAPEIRKETPASRPERFYSIDKVLSMPSIRIIGPTRPHPPTSTSAVPFEENTTGKKSKQAPRLSSKLSAFSDPSILAYICGHSACYSSVTFTSSACFSTSAELMHHHKKQHARDPCGEDDRPFKCGVAGCGKGWKSVNGLQYHLQISKAHVPQPDVPTTTATTLSFSSYTCPANPNPSLSSPQFAQSQATVKPKKPPKTHDCPYPSCQNRYKQLSGLRYHYFHAHKGALADRVANLGPNAAPQTAPNPTGGTTMASVPMPPPPPIVPLATIES